MGFVEINSTYLTSPVDLYEEDEVQKNSRTGNKGNKTKRAEFLGGKPQKGSRSWNLMRYREALRAERNSQPTNFLKSYLGVIDEVPRYSPRQQKIS